MLGSVFYLFIFFLFLFVVVVCLFRLGVFDNFPRLCRTASCAEQPRYGRQVVSLFCCWLLCVCVGFVIVVSFLVRLPGLTLV